jgi:hypothetical protein
MVEVRVASMITQSILNEVKSAILLHNKDLLLLIEHPLEGSDFIVKVDGLLAVPFPVSAVHD